jgi:hypothetical protein
LTTESRQRPSRRSFAACGTFVIAVTATALMLAGGEAQAAVTVPPLGTATSFAVLAGAGITNTGPTTISGDIGTFPTTSETGTASITLNGANHAGDGTTQSAKTDLTTAYTTAAGEGPTLPITADLAGQVLTAGVYNSGSSIGLSGALTLNAAGDPNAVFVFQAGSTLTTGSGSSVVLTNGAQACNVYWQIGSSATLGTNSSFTGSILALTSVTVTTGAVISGRVLARNGAVTLDTNTITRPICAAPISTTTPAATTSSATSSPTVSATSTATRSATSPATTPATTSPAAGSTGTSAQVTPIPVGGVHTGDGSTQHGRSALPVIAGGLIAGAALLTVVRRRRTR